METLRDIVLRILGFVMDPYADLCDYLNPLAERYGRFFDLREPGGQENSPEWKLQELKIFKLLEGCVEFLAWIFCLSLFLILLLMVMGIMPHHLQGIPEGLRWEFLWNYILAGFFLSLDIVFWALGWCQDLIGEEFIVIGIAALLTLLVIRVAFALKR